VKHEVDEISTKSDETILACAETFLWCEMNYLPKFSWTK